MVFATGTSAYVDIQNHWAEDAIDRWSEYSVVQGKGDGVFDPEGQMTRAEAAQVFANLLGLNKVADLSGFKDVKNAWYKEAIAKCYAAGILNGKGEGKMDPNGKITREEFLTMYARAVCISNGTDETEAKKVLKQKGYTDTNKVSDWAADAVSVLVEKGFVKGVSENKLAPKNNIDRASVMSLLNQSISTYVGKDSKETTVTAKSEGITLIANTAVTKVTGNADVVVVAAGAEKYNEATGEIEHNDIKVESAKMPIARVEGENITVTLTINTQADDAEVTITGVDSEIVIESTSSAKNVTLSAEGSKATVAGKVETIKVEETAKEAVVDTKSTAKVETVENKAESTTVKGSGTVTEVKSSENVTIETKNTKVENTNEEKQIVVTDSKGTETKVETKAEGTGTTGSTTPGTTPSETVVNKQETPTGGGGSTHSHTYSNVWTVDSVNHWHVATCQHTGEKGSFGAHDTEGEGSACSVCGYKIDAVAMIPSASGNKYYSTLPDAITSASAISNATVIVLTDCAIDSEIVINKNMTIDLNDKTISNNKTGSRPLVISDCAITITNGAIVISEENTESYGIIDIFSDVDAVLTLSGIRMYGNTFFNNNDDSGNGALINIAAVSDVAIGTLNMINVSATSNNRIQYCPTLDGEVHMNVIGGVYSSTRGAFALDSYSSESTAVFSNVTATSDIGPVIELDTVTGTFRDCDFNVTGLKQPEDWYSTTIGVAFDAVANIISGTYSSVSASAIEIYPTGGIVNISGGTFSSVKSIRTYDADEDCYSDISISGGVFTGELDLNHTRTTAIITGGTFDHDPSEYVPTCGYMTADNNPTDGWTVVEKPYNSEEDEVQIDTPDGKTLYGTLGQFRDDVNHGIGFGGHTVTVLRDLNYTDEDWVPIGGYFYGTFDGNNKIIEVQNKNISALDYGFFMYLYSEDENNPCTIKNLTLDVDFRLAKGCSKVFMGGLASSLYYNVDIENVTVSGIIVGDRVVGGIAGNCYSASSYGLPGFYHIRNCNVVADISCYSVYTENNWLCIGGIVGQSDAKEILEIAKCSFTGKLETEFDDTHQTGASSYIGYVMGKGANDGGKEITKIANFTVGDGSSIIGYQNVGTHNYPFEGLNKATGENTYNDTANPNKELLGGYFYQCTIDDETTGGSGQNFYDHGVATEQ